MPRILDENLYDAVDSGLAARMHKAIAVIQFKVEGAMIMRHPEYGMEDRLLLPAVDYEKGTVTIGGRAYPMLDTNFPTIDPRNPLELTRGRRSFCGCCPPPSATARFSIVMCASSIPTGAFTPAAIPTFFTMAVFP